MNWLLGLAAGAGIAALVERFSQGGLQGNPLSDDERADLKSKAERKLYFYQKKLSDFRDQERIRGYRLIGPADYARESQKIYRKAEKILDHINARERKGLRLSDGDYKSLLRAAKKAKKSIESTLKLSDTIEKNYMEYFKNLAKTKIYEPDLTIDYIEHFLNVIRDRVNLLGYVPDKAKPYYKEANIQYDEAVNSRRIFTYAPSYSREIKAIDSGEKAVYLIRETKKIVDKELKKKGITP